jgi:archaellum component FlaC
MELNITSEQLYEMMERVAEAESDRVVYEFRKDSDGDLDRIVEITEHVERLESEI